VGENEILRDVVIADEFLQAKLADVDEEHCDAFGVCGECGSRKIEAELRGVVRCGASCSLCMVMRMLRQATGPLGSSQPLKFVTLLPFGNRQ
jgi:hypothetical protein